MPPAFPEWLTILSVVSLAMGVVCALVIVVDLFRHPQKMAVMNIVWVTTALFGSVLWLAAYWRWSRNLAGKDERAPMPVMIFKASSHCGAGCTMGDLIAEWLVWFVPSVALWFGWHSWFAEKIFAVWILDFLLAYVIGVGIQYFTIAPMRHLSVGPGILAALKADTVSIIAWQLGMYGLMALIQFAWFRPAYGDVAPVGSVEFWFAMQLAMIAGFVTSYPFNWLLVRIGWKEKM
jgi:hypothetical protein